MDTHPSPQTPFEEALTTDLIEICSVYGLLIKQSSDRKKQLEYQHAPMSLFPTPFPIQAYEKIYAWQEDLGWLVSSLCSEPAKMHKILGSFLKYDPFLARLVQVSQRYNDYALSSSAEKRNKIQSMHMNILRSDYMLDCRPPATPKLVEYNCIASSFGILSQRVNQVQAYIRQKYENDPIVYGRKQLEQDTAGVNPHILQFGQNAMSQFSDNMIGHFKRAIDFYKASVSTKFKMPSDDPWVLFVIDEAERNVID